MCLFEQRKNKCVSTSNVQTSVAILVCSVFKQVVSCGRLQERLFFFLPSFWQKRWRIWLRIRRGNLPVCISSLTCGLLFTTRKISILTPVLLERWGVIISFRTCSMIGVGLSYLTLGLSYNKIFFNCITFLGRKKNPMFLNATSTV